MQILHLQVVRRRVRLRWEQNQQTSAKNAMALWQKANRKADRVCVGCDRLTIVAKRTQLCKSCAHDTETPNEAMRKLRTLISEGRKTREQGIEGISKAWNVTARRAEHLLDTMPEGAPPRKPGGNCNLRVKDAAAFFAVAYDTARKALRSHTESKGVMIKRLRGKGLVKTVVGSSNPYVDPAEDDEDPTVVRSWKAAAHKVVEHGAQADSSGHVFKMHSVCPTPAVPARPSKERGSRGEPPTGSKCDR
ncbi:hypothetical protein M427DRAFT_66878 [Gonapodya prolifera JEL478]|uniref:Uncharacterized protein n=1 Tax=Gonapodya prolifera (strain JEL478) TaxID=1344416 RepID=A0A139ASK0_GONPJ|nr:hypothetical protein M427DRAFT_66878 [Gonapodya prolifera JEL478]|eukprot:KXS19722.1 hypothetical protein M427DRAFT_66878 [Gonapodya prolifera JEL478]